MVPDHDGGRGENGAELAGSEGFQGAQAAFEFGGGYAAQAIEGAQKIFGGGCSLLRVAFDAAGNEIAVGIAASTDMRDDMVEDSPTSDEAPRACHGPRSTTSPAKFRHCGGVPHPHSFQYYLYTYDAQ